MSVTVYTSVNLSPVECYQCGVIFGLPADFNQNRLRDHDAWYCPNGHRQSYIGKTEEQKLREQLKRAEVRRAATLDLLTAEEKSHSATRGHLTRAKKRAAAGVCPCCKRHFANVERHVAGQHPEFVKEVNA